MVLGCVILFSSCAYKDPYFDPYVKMVKDYCVEYNGENCEKVDYVSISLGEVEKNRLAQCGMNGITVDKNSWEELSDCEKEVLILHEYGHCAFGKEDNTETLFLYHPQNLMYYIPLDTANLYCSKEEYKNQYLKEFFNN